MLKFSAEYKNLFKILSTLPSNGMNGLLKPMAIIADEVYSPIPGNDLS